MMEEGRRHPILLPCTQKHTCRGPCIKDVRTEGGGGLRNLPILRTNSTDRLREMRTRGREGVQKSQNFADVLYVWSHRWMDGEGETLCDVHGLVTLLSRP